MNNDSISTVGLVTLKGALGARLDAMIARHVAATDVDYITAPFLEKTETRGWWQTEFWGKWMHSAIPYLAYRHDPALEAKVARGISRILASQEPDGYIGNYPEELRCGEGWDVWGVKYTMMGLLHYCDWAQRRENAPHQPTALPGRDGALPHSPALHGREDRAVPGQSAVPGQVALAACRRLCDWLVAELGPNGRRGIPLWQTGNWCGLASSSVLEPVVWLYRRTGDRKYLDFASYIVDGLSTPEAGPRLIDLALKGVSVADRNGHGNQAESGNSYVMTHNRWKAYEMMSCYQGILDYADAIDSDAPGGADTASLRRAAIMAAEDIAKEEVNLAGGCASSEAWFHGARKQHLAYTRLQETCVTTTWMRLCEKLLDITGDPAWADRLETTFHNAYLAAMKLDASEFAGYTPLTGSRWHGQHHCFMHTDCCTANGPRGFLAYLRKFFTASGDTATLNFYSSALVRATLGDGREVAFDCYSLYPRDGYARLVCHTAGNYALRLRVPASCASASVTVNGVPLPCPATPGEYLTIRRPWALGDIVEAKFDLPVVAHVTDFHVAFTRGPVLLARDSRFADGDIAEPFRPDAIADGEDCSSWFTVTQPPSDDIRMTFSATLPLGAHAENPDGALPSAVHFCDYASAGNSWLRDDHYRTWFPIERLPSQ